MIYILMLLAAANINQETIHCYINETGAVEIVTINDLGDVDVIEATKEFILSECFDMQIESDEAPMILAMRDVK